MPRKPKPINYVIVPINVFKPNLAKYCYIVGGDPCRASLSFNIYILFKKITRVATVSIEESDTNQKYKIYKLIN